MRAWKAVLVLPLLVAPAAPAAADFDLVHVDHVDVTLCSNGCGITLADWGFALLVNTGATPLTADEVFATTFQVTSSTAAISLLPFVNNPGPPIMPILPGEAVGSVQAPNQVLLSCLGPGEIFRNTAPLQFLAFEILRNGPYEGPVVFDVVMSMAGYHALFSIRADVHLGKHAISFLSCDRTSAIPGPTPARTSSWGRIKTLYRR